MTERDFWKWLGVRFGMVLAVVAAVGGTWAIHRALHSGQDRAQAALLAEISGYQGQPNPDRAHSYIRAVVGQIHSIGPGVSLEASLLEWLNWPDGRKHPAMRLKVIRLIRTSPGSITAASKGVVAVAQGFENKWLSSVRFWAEPPYLGTIVGLFVAGAIIVFLCIGVETGERHQASVDRFSDIQALRETLEIKLSELQSEKGDLEYHRDLLMIDHAQFYPGLKAWEDWFEVEPRRAGISGVC